jgi:UDP-2-acetamido-2,6-beta-L-arabino-hexul-4-ose reductase
MDKNVLVTGAAGFLGRNLCVALKQRRDVDLVEIDATDERAKLEQALLRADIVFHLAGVNRPEKVEEFAAGNAGFTGEVLAVLAGRGRKPKVVLTSSVQAERENPYGASKRGAENELRAFCDASGAEGVVYRLKNLFGKWGRPNYNSVTATFCHNIARDLPIQISDPGAEVDLTYVDDVVEAFLREIDAPPEPSFQYASELPSHHVTLGRLADIIRSFHAHRETLRLADYSEPFVRALYATYLSFVEPERHGYQLDIKTDARGSLAEFIKSPHVGQMFVSRTKPGITRGNHYHHTKTEKFMVVEGQAIIRLRQIEGERVIEFPVRGTEYRVVDIPPGFTHSIENVGTSDMVTLFWASEIFDPAKPDTYALPVTPDSQH